MLSSQLSAVTRSGAADSSALAQITGAVLNMSHFLCPGSSTPHYIFGPPDAFDSTCADLSLDVLARIPIEPAVSSRGDSGAPIVMLAGPVPSSGDEPAAAGPSKAREVFLSLGEQVWQRLQQGERA